MAKKTAPGGAKSAAQLREERLKAALKANLARRKAQSRARDGVNIEDGPKEARQDKDS